MWYAVDCQCEYDRFDICCRGSNHFPSAKLKTKSVALRAARALDRRREIDSCCYIVRSSERVLQYADTVLRTGTIRFDLMSIRAFVRSLCRPMRVVLQTIKYGVIGMKELCTDMNTWNELYVAGRLHKPVTLWSPQMSDIELNKPLRTDGTATTTTTQSLIREFAEARDANLRGALHTAMLMAPAYFSELKLYELIAGLSSTGDVRVGVAEHPDKIKNLVTPQIAAYRRLYAPYLEQYCAQVRATTFNPETGIMTGSTEAAKAYDGFKLYRVRTHNTHGPTQAARFCIEVDSFVCVRICFVFAEYRRAGRVVVVHPIRPA